MRPQPETRAFGSILENVVCATKDITVPEFSVGPTL